MPPISDKPNLQLAISQFNHVCVLEMRLEAAKKLLARYMASVPIAERAEYVEKTTEIQEKYHQLKRET